MVLISFLVISPKLFAQAECPCDFDSVPKETECWLDPFNTVQPNYDSFPTQPPMECILDNVFSSAGTRMDFSVFTEPDGSKTCRIVQENIPLPCQVQTVPELELTPEEVLACRCELLAYTTALNEVAGISVEVQGGPPYECFDVDLRTCPEGPPTPIPTLNEYGMIITAGVLGLLVVIGLFVMRTRRTVAGGRGPDGANQ